MDLRLHRAIPMKAICVDSIEGILPEGFAKGKKCFCSLWKCFSAKSYEGKIWFWIYIYDAKFSKCFTYTGKNYDLAQKSFDEMKTALTKK
jgi:hypothetical protein